MTIDEMIKVLEAHKSGQKVQFKSKEGGAGWCDVDYPIWSFNHDDYRVKPEPREFWINVETGAVYSAPVRHAIKVREVIYE